MSLSSLKLMGEPERLTDGESDHAFASVSEDGTVLFTSGSSNRYLWTLPVDVNTGRKLGEKRRLTRAASFESVQYLASKANRLVYFAQRLGKPGIYVRDLDSESESLVTDRRSVMYPILNPDGSKVAITLGSDEQNEIRILPAGGGAGEALCRSCGYAREWSPDGRWILTQGGGDDSRVFAVDVTTKEGKEILSAAGLGLSSAQFSPDMRWIAFYSRSKDSAERLFVAPFLNGQPIPQNAWIPVTDGKASDNKPRWSPNGNLIYFTSDREGGESIWAQRLDPSTKKPRGEPFLVEQLRRGLLTRVEGGQGDISVARDRLIFSFAEVRSNLWKTRIPK